MAANETIELGRETLVALVIQTRHGARFPYKKVFGGDLNWPSSSSFWSLYEGLLSPVGTQLMTKIGSDLKEHYQIHEGKSAIIPNQEWFKWIYVQSTNKTRTVLSSMALLLGLYPESLLRIRVDEDSQPDYMDDPSDLADDRTVTIHIKHMNTQVDPFCNLQHSEEYVQLKSKVFEVDGKWAEWEKDVAYQNLVEKLFKMTEWEKLDPEKYPSVRFRLQQVYGIDENLELEFAHKMIPLRNRHHLALTEEDLQMIREINSYTWSVRYCGHNDDDAKAISSLLAKGMGLEILQRLSDVIEGKTTFRFFYFSSHDTAIAPLLSLLGIRHFPSPKLSSYLIFELHKKEEIYYIKSFFNHDPAHISVENSPPIDICSIGESIDFDKCSCGVVSFDKFKERVFWI